MQQSVFLLLTASPTKQTSITPWQYSKMQPTTQPSKPVSHSPTPINNSKYNQNVSPSTSKTHQVTWSSLVMTAHPKSRIVGIVIIVNDNVHFVRKAFIFKGQSVRDSVRMVMWKNINTGVCWGKIMKGHNGKNQILLQIMRGKGKRMMRECEEITR